MDFLKASVEQVTAYFMERWGEAGGHTQISEHDLSKFDLAASARDTEEWQRAVIGIALNHPNQSRTHRYRLFDAIKVAVAQGVEVPLATQQAQPTSADTTFKNLENRYHYIRRHIELFPDIDPYGPHDIEMMCDAIIVGRFDVAAQIFVSAENKTKKAWIRKLRLV